MSFAYVRRHASFPLASHLAVSSNAVRVGYTVVRFNRVRIELTFYHYSLKRTHNLGLEGGLNFRWQYSIEVVIINKGEQPSFEEELTRDVMEIMTVFCAKLYGQRSHKSKKMAQEIENIVSEEKEQLEMNFGNPTNTEDRT